MTIGKLKTTKFERFMAVLLSISMLLSSVTGISLINSAEAAGTAKQWQMHFMARHWHEIDGGEQTVTSGSSTAVQVDGYIYPDNIDSPNYYTFNITVGNATITDTTAAGTVGDYDVTKEGTATTVKFGSKEILSFNTADGTAKIYVNPYTDDDGEYLENFTGFSMSAGHSAIDAGGDGANSYITVTYKASVPLAKAHIFYQDISMYVAGAPSTVVVGSSDLLEEDTKYLYADTSGDLIDENGVSIDTSNGDPVEVPAEDLLFENSKVTLNPNAPQEIIDARPTGAVKVVKVYSNAEGLHTDKTALVNDFEERTYDIELESWFVGADIANVAMILDASGSMAWPSDDITDNIISGKEFYSFIYAYFNINEFTDSATAKDEGIIIYDPNGDGTQAGEVNWKIGTGEEEDTVYFADETAFVAYMNGEDAAKGRIITLNQEIVDQILDNTKTDNSSMGYGDYSYFIFDSRSENNEPTQIGYWDGDSVARTASTEIVIEEKFFTLTDDLIGYYPFAKDKYIAGSTSDQDDRDWLLNVASILESKDNPTYAKILDTRKDAASEFSFDTGDFTEVANAGTAYYKTDMQFTDGGNWIINKENKSSKGIYLDAVPTGDFTLSFKITTASGASTPSAIYDVIYVGNLENAAATPHLRFLRQQQNSTFNGNIDYDTNKTGNGKRFRGYYGYYTDKNYVIENGNSGYKQVANDSTGVMTAGTTTVFTYVLEGSVLTTYVDGVAESSVGAVNNFTSDRNILINALTDSLYASAYNSGEIGIDEIYVYDAALNTDAVAVLADIQKTKSDVLPEDLQVQQTVQTKVTTSQVYYAITQGDDDNDITLAGISGAGSYYNGSGVTADDRAGWYYLSSTSAFYNNYIQENILTGKTIAPLYPSTGSLDYNYYGEQYNSDGSLVTIPSNMTDAGAGDDAESIFSYTVTKYQPNKFFINEGGRLCCFYNSGQVADGRYGWSYVYEKEDSQRTKSEALQYALGLFVNDLNEESPLSKVSAVRFSTAIGDQTAGLREESIDKLVMLDWTNDVKESATILNLQRGITNNKEGTTLGYDESDSGLKQYNYGLTGGTNTWTGLQSFVENLADTADDNAKKYMIVFTDGKDTVFENEEKDAAYRTKAFTIADELRYDAESNPDGYIIFPVMLSAGSVKRGTADFENAYRFLYQLSTGTPISTDRIGQIYLHSSDVEDLDAYLEDNGYSVEGTTSRILDEDGYPVLLSSYTGISDVYVGDNTDELVQIFTDDILGQITDHLYDYTVQDYIDPRFDLIDANGDLWNLQNDGIVVKPVRDEDGELVTDSDGNAVTETINAKDGELITDTFGDDTVEYYLVAEDVEISDDCSEGAAIASLYYDATNDMYFVRWVYQIIPGCAVDSGRMSVWNVKFTVKAKEDFLGGNAVLTNGNDNNMNYVYYGGEDDEEEDIPRDSGTDNMYRKGQGGDSDNVRSKYPSKGFPRTSVNVLIPEIETPSEEQIIYMGETVTPESVVQMMGEAITDTLNQPDMSSSLFDAKSWYWEYLIRYFDGELKGNGIPGSEDTYTDFEDLLIQIINAADSEEGYRIPYYYIYSQTSENTTGTDDHKVDLLGNLYFKWNSENGDSELDDDATVDTVTRLNHLTITYVPLPAVETSEEAVPEQGIALTAEGEGEDPTDRAEANESLIQDDAYETVKDPVGNNQPVDDEQAATLTATGSYQTEIIKGEVELQVKLDKDDIAYLISHGYKGTITYTADLVRTYGAVSGEVVGGFTATYTLPATAPSEDVVLNAVFDNSGYVAGYDSDTGVKGLPIGTYTLSNATYTFKDGTKDNTSVVTFDYAELGTPAAALYDSWSGSWRTGVTNPATDLTNFTKYLADGTNNTNAHAEVYLGTAESYNGTAYNEDGEIVAADGTVTRRYTDDRYGLLVVPMALETGSLEVSKTVVDEVGETNDWEFDFTVVFTQEGGDPLTGNISYSKNGTAATATLTADGTYTFKLKDGDTITFTDLPTGVTYTVTENGRTVTDPSANSDWTGGFTAEDETYEVSGVIGYDTDGNALDGGEANEVSYVNTYAADGELIVAVQKNIIGRDWSDSDSFTFTLTADEEYESVIMPDPATVTITKDNADDGYVDAFGAIQFTNTGTFKFTVTETSVSGGDFNANNQTYTIEVTVTDNLDGTLNVAATYALNGTASTGEPALVFDNETYVEYSLPVSKDIDGRDWIEGDSFTFTITNLAAAPDDADAKDVEYPTEPITISYDTSKTQSFEDIVFYSTGTYTFTITETQLTGDTAGLTYDTTHTVKVTVGTDSDGELAVTSVVVDGKTDITNSGSAEFTNTYEAEGELSVTVDKSIDGREWITDDSYSFTIEGADDATKAAIGTYIVLPDDLSVSGASHSVTDTITFKSNGQAETTYKFVISEDDPDTGLLGGISKDTTSYELTVIVTDDFKGNLTVAVSGGSASVTFVNTYTIENNADLDIGITKTLTGRDWIDTDSFEFTLTLTKIDADTAPTAVAEGDTWTVTIDDGEDEDTAYPGAFSTITLDAAGKYTFILVEETIDENGVKSDPVTYTIVVTVKDDKHGALEVDSVNITSSMVSGTLSKDTLPFTNTYKAEPVTLSDIITVTKVLEGREWETSDEFTFVIEPVEDYGDAVTIDNNTVTVTGSDTKNADGSITVDGGTITFNEVGEYEFTVREVKPNPAITGIKYDEVPRTFTVTVSDPDHDGQLVAEIDVDEFEFINIYKAGTTELEIKKAQAVGDGTPTDEKLTVEANDTVTYYITVTNIGDTIAEGVVLTDEIPDGLTLGTINNDGTLLDDGKTIVWYIGDVEDEVTVSFTVTVPEVDEDTEWTNIATVSYDNNADNPEKDPDTSEEEPDPNDPHKDKTTQDSNEVVIEETAEPGTPELEIKKTQAVNGGTATDEKLTVEANDTVTYYITVTNIGDTIAEGVVLTDEIPEGLTLGTINDDGKLLDDGKTIVWYIGDVEDEVTVSFTVTVPEVDEDTEWTNIATVSYDNNPDNPEKDPDTSEEEPDPNDPHKDKTTQDSNEVVIEEDAIVEPPATEPPATEPPATEPPATEPPATEPPATEPPVTEPPTTEAGDNNDNEQENPSTGVALNVTAAMTGMAFLAAGALSLRKRKNGKNSK